MTVEPTACVHVYPVDPSLAPEEAWKEICIFGQRITFTGEPLWGVMVCDGEECRGILHADAREGL